MKIEMLKKLMDLNIARTQGEWLYSEGGLYTKFPDKTYYDHILTPGGDSGSMLSPDPCSGSYLKQNDADFITFLANNMDEILASCAVTKEKLTE